MNPPKIGRPFGAKPPKRNGALGSSASGNTGGNRWERQSREFSERAPSRRLQDPRSSAARQAERSAGTSSSASADLDLVSALSARESESSSSLPFPRESGVSTGNRSGSRSGGRIRMDAPKSVRTGPRARAIPNAPRYRANARPVNWRAILLVTLSALIVSYGLTYLFSSPTLALQSIVIKGVPPATASLLQTELPGEPFGSNLLRYALANHRIIDKSIGGAEADFASVSVGIYLPHTLVVTIVKREPVALLSMAGRSWALDSRGMPIRQGDDPQLAGISLPQLVITPATGDEVAAPTIGRPFPSSLAQKVRVGYALLKALRRQPGLSSFGSVQVDALQNVTLAFPNGLLMKLGQPIDLDTKLALANTLMQQHPDVAAQAQYIDVSYPARPAMLPKGVKVSPPVEASTVGSTGTVAATQPGISAPDESRLRSAATLH